MREEEGRQRQAAGVKPPRRSARTPVAESAPHSPAAPAPAGEASPSSPLAGAGRDNKKLARLRRRGELAEFKRELVEEVFRSCTAIANLNCNLDQPTPLSNDGAVLVGKQLVAGCSWVHTLWLERNHIGPAGAKEIAKGLRQHKHLTDLSLAENPLKTEGMEHIAQALAEGECPMFTLNIKNTQVIRIPLCLQDVTLLKEIVSEDNPLLFPPREVMHRGTAHIMDFLKDQRVQQSVFDAEAALEREKRDEARDTGGGVTGRDIKTPLTERELRLQEREEKLKNWQSSLEFKEASLDTLREVMDVRQRDIRETLLYGTWWHSTIPSLDPVGLTWQKQSAAQLDAQEEEDGKKLKYTDDKPLEHAQSPARSPGPGRRSTLAQSGNTSPQRSPGAEDQQGFRRKQSRFDTMTKSGNAGSEAGSPLYSPTKI